MSLVSPAERAVRALLDEVIQQVAGYRVPPAASFFEAGLSSVLLVRIQAQLQQRLGYEVPIWAAFKYPNCHQLARYLVRMAEGARSQLTAPVAPVRGTTTPGRAAASPAELRRGLRARIRDNGE